jgi:hypothetical protein
MMAKKVNMRVTKLNYLIFTVLFLYFEVFGLFLIYGNQKNPIIVLLKKTDLLIVNLSFEIGLLFDWFLSNMLINTIIWGVIGQLAMLLLFWYFYKLILKVAFKIFL